jgi:two-component system response regulator NreC
VHPRDVSSGLKTLSPREVAVLRLLVLGHTNREIGALLHVSVRTVESHRANLRRKLGVSRRSELVRLALASRAV